jgi:F0F1-type ATP synthase membrane subunit b/b'
MKRLSPEKRNKLIAVVVATLVVIGLIYYFLIGPEIDDKEKLAKDVKTAIANLETIKQDIKPFNELNDLTRSSITAL